jgi:hypothetical protein
LGIHLLQRSPHILNLQCMIFLLVNRIPHSTGFAGKKEKLFEMENIHDGCATVFGQQLCQTMSSIHFKLLKICDPFVCVCSGSRFSKNVSLENKRKSSLERKHEDMTTSFGQKIAETTIKWRNLKTDLQAATTKVCAHTQKQKTNLKRGQWVNWDTQ